MKNTKMKYQKNLCWNMLFEDGKLLITKGADEIYFIDDVNSKNAALIFDAYKDDTLDNLAIKEEEINITIKKLEKAGVIYKSKSSIEFPINKISVAIEWLGNKNIKIQNLLEEFIKKSKNIIISDDTSKVSILFLIRGSNKMVDLLKDYKKINVPHVLIDLAYDHTISIGPLVFPEETACLGCFVGRITRNWGDATPPEFSKVNESYELITSLILENIKTFQRLGSCPELIDQVWSLNLKDFSSKYDKIFRLPWCPICFPEKVQEGTGSFELPWKISNNQLK